MATAFDPDAFLKQSAPPPAAFDPDVFLGLNQYGSAVPQVNAQGQIIRQPDAIPGERPSFRDVAGAVVETPLALATGAVGGVVAPIVGVGSTLLSGKYGTQEGIKIGQQTAGKVQQALTYQPQTRGGQATVGAIGETLEPLQAVPFSQGLTAATLAPAAAKQAITKIGKEADYLKGAIGEIPAVKASKEAKIADSYARGPQIDAANLAQKYNISLDPAISNPTARNRIRSGLVGSADLSNRLTQANEPKWTAAVKKDLELDDKISLTNPKIFDDVRARDDIAGPYEKVREIKSIVVQPDALNKIDELRVAPLYGDTGQAAATNAFLDKVKSDLQSGGNGAKLLKSIQQMRQEAQNILRAEKAGNPIAPAARMEADAKMKAAKVLESMIDDNITNIGARDAFIKARQKMAQTYDIEAATDFGTGKIDPTVFAKMVSQGDPVSGVVADLGKIASNFPEVVSGATSSNKFIPAFTRVSPGGALGAIIGAAGGPVSATIGAAAGASTAEIIRRVAANRMLSPEFQTARAIPKDYRPQASANALRPVEPGQSNIVPFNPVNALVEPEIRPNFVFGQPEPLVDVRPVRPGGGPRQIGMDTPDQVIARQRAEEARRTRMAQMAETEGLAAEARSRAPTAREMILDVDPITGKLLPASQGIRGATPETFQDYTATLRSATEKLSSGQKFALDAAEKIAFDKTRVDLAEVVPGFKALTDKAIAERMMDRKWIADTVKTAREKAAAFEQIARKSNDQALVQQAQANRERMLDVAEMMEDNLRNLRPDTSRKQQGPKTRAAKRNALRGDVETLNKLVE
jgi:hypothetical protein